MRPSALVLALALTLTGCFPYACNREESRALLPADSLARVLAETVPMDTLHSVWTVTETDAPLAFPRTASFGPDGALYVSDAEENAVYVFDPADGALRTTITDETFAVPYLAGWRGDTLGVFHPTARRLDLLVDGDIVGAVPTPDDLPEAGTLQFAALAPDAVFFKTVGEDPGSGYLARLDEDGTVTARASLPGPGWRYAGRLRVWGDSLVSLSGFRPVVDVWAGGRLDTLALQGFDSPMLSRSRLFLMGEKDQAPLLSESAVPVGDRLFVLNLRPGWLRVDVYGRDGVLQHRLVQDQPAFRKQYYPRDLAVRPRPDGSYDLAIARTSPEPAVELYRWTPRPALSSPAL